MTNEQMTSDNPSLGVAETVTTVLGEIDTVMAAIDADQIQHLVDRMAAAGRVFVTGEGRSGLMSKAFAMRLMHLGLTVHVIGETTTPSVAAGDTVVAVSGSGTTQGTVRVAEAAAKAGATVHAVSTDPDSPLARAAAETLVLPAATKYRRADEAATIQPLSSLFDQASHIAFDVVCLQLARSRGVDNAAARAAHSNTE